MMRESRDVGTAIETHAQNLEGYGAVFNSPTTIRERGRTFKEVVRPGAFDRALATHSDILVCFNHDINRLLGRTSSGTAKVWVDAKGLRFSVQLPESAHDVRELAARGDLRGCSFTFSVRAERWSDDKSTRELTDLDLYELGPVVRPAYASATLGRSIDLKRLMLRTFRFKF